MNEAPVLTKKQQRLSLSARKKRTKQVIRNVFATPYKKYWPCASEEHSKVICDSLRKELPKKLPEETNLPWDALKEVPRSERASVRETQKQTVKNNEDSTKLKEGLVFGVNDVTKELEKGTAKSVLISKDVQPKLMTEHVIDQCVLHRIPVLVVQGLKAALTNICGFSSIAMGFSTADKYQDIQQTIKRLQEEYYPVPDNHINRNRSINLFNVGDAAEQNNTNEECVIIDISDSDTESPSKTGHEIKDVYLYRKSKDTRVFVPPANDDRGIQIDISGFLSFAARKADCNKNYNSLTVNRVKGNVNRNKNKIEAVKKRKRKSKN